MAKQELVVQGKNIRYTTVNGMDYVCITDIAKQKNPEFPADVVRNWMRTKSTVLFLGLWEKLHNPDFKLVEFDQFKMVYYDIQDYKDELYMFWSSGSLFVDRNPQAKDLIWYARLGELE